MDKYSVQLMNRALQDLDEIYAYIVSEFSAPTAAENLIDRIEQAILSLEDTPKRGSVRRTGVFTDREYRQLFVKNYTIVYRVEEENKRVLIVTVRYTPSCF